MEENTNKTGMEEYLNKSEKELLAELVVLQKKTGRKSVISLIIACVCVVILLVSVILVVPKLSSALSSANQIINEIEGSVDAMNSVVKQADKVMTENADTVNSVLTKINEIDFDSLNNSIASLSDILEPIANTFNIFK